MTPTTVQPAGDAPGPTGDAHGPEGDAPGPAADVPGPTTDATDASDDVADTADDVAEPALGCIRLVDRMFGGGEDEGGDEDGRTAHAVERTADAAEPAPGMPCEADAEAATAAYLAYARLFAEHKEAALRCGNTTQGLLWANVPKPLRDFMDEHSGNLIAILVHCDAVHERAQDEAAAAASGAMSEDGIVANSLIHVACAYYGKFVAPLDVRAVRAAQNINSGFDTAYEVQLMEEQVACTEDDCTR